MLKLLYLDINNNNKLVLEHIPKSKDSNSTPTL